MKASKVESWLPLGYFAAALLLVVALLPTVLRPPQQPPTQTASLSPDAPPDPDQQSIISSFRRGSSGTAGEAGGDGDGDGGPPTTLLTTKRAARGCRYGFGNPPRQTFSFYSGPCAPPCPQATTGGSKGVTANEIRVAVGWPFAAVGTEGPVPASHTPGESDDDRTWIDIQQWLNSRYDFCGRRMQLHVINGGDDRANYSAIAARIDQEIHAFAAVYGRYELMAELARRKVIAFGEQADQFSESYYAAHHPYIWNWTPSTTVMLRMTAEYACKKLAGKPAAFTDDPLLQGQPRKFAIVYNVRAGSTPLDDEFGVPFKASCNGELPTRIAYGDGANNGASGPPQTVARLRQDGITTVVTALDFATMASITNEAAATGYSPEWLVTSVGNLDFPNQARFFMNQAQWSHAFGLSALEMEWAGQDPSLDGNDADTDCVKAVAEIDPGFSPAGLCILFPSLLQLANGVQGAGPNLNPQTFEQALTRIRSRGPTPPWSIGGGYSATNHAYPAYAAEIWYDPDAINPKGTTGNYIWTHNGRKFTHGEWDSDTSELFTKGIITRSQAEAAGS